MPILPSEFQPPAWLRGGHRQTILAATLKRGIALEYQRERLELADGDFLDLDWCRSGHGRLAVITHGLEGNSREAGIRGMAAAMKRAGWDVLAWNLRSCSGSPNRLARFYHSGETNDLRFVIKHASTEYRSVALVGFSLGGNIQLKYLGEAAADPVIAGAVAFSVPVHLPSNAKVLDERRTNRVYLRRFLKSLVAKVKQKAAQHPGLFDLEGIDSIRSFQEFDGRYTAPMNGFRDAMDYWQQSSALGYLSKIRTPTLLVNALDDPFLTPESMPLDVAAASEWLHLETPESGGHLGFIDGSGQPWSERRAVEFLERTCGSAGDRPL